MIVIKSDYIITLTNYSCSAALTDSLHFILLQQKFNQKHTRVRNLRFQSAECNISFLQSFIVWLFYELIALIQKYQKETEKCLYNYGNS